VADVPTGISSSEQRKILVDLRARGEIANVPPAQLDPILARAKKDLREQPETPGQNPPTP